MDLKDFDLQMRGLRIWDQPYIEIKPRMTGEVYCSKALGDQKLKKVLLRPTLWHRMQASKPFGRNATAP